MKHNPKETQSKLSDIIMAAQPLADLLTTLADAQDVQVKILSTEDSHILAVAEKAADLQELATKMMPAEAMRKLAQQLRDVQAAFVEIGQTKLKKQQRGQNGQEVFDASKN